MGNPVREAYVGQFVYQYGSPQKAGVIIEIVHPVGSPQPVPGLAGTEGKTRPRRFATVKVKWVKDRSVTEVVANRLQDLKKKTHH